MKKWIQRNIVYLIAVIILITLFIQAYWNVKNYETNKVTVNNEVLSALNSSVDAYYTNLAKSEINYTSNDQNIFLDGGLPEDLQKMIDSIIDNAVPGKTKNDGAFIKDITIIGSDTSAKDLPPPLKDMLKKRTAAIPSKMKEEKPDIASLATKVIISITNDSIDFKQLSKYLDNELKRKGFSFKYAITHTQPDSTKVSFGKPEKHELSVESKSAYLPSGSHLIMYYPNINLLALKEGLAGILISFFFTVAIIISLLYLLRIIKQQKQLVHSKNDFISNISHELKTPIATSLSALEALQLFNTNNDPEKTEKYMGIASQQLKKLNVMVEKILDTASLDSDKLALQKEMTDIVPIAKSVVEKHELNTSKTINFTTQSNILLANIDSFHFENVINNIVENAIKYGGDTINVNITPGPKQAFIKISDNGNPIDKIDRNRIFEKFYRVSTHNRHDVKGYGIGLYYSKNIIDKHNGRLTLEDDSKQTVFKITVPYV